jgi:hypothetical protein
MVQGRWNDAAAAYGKLIQLEETGQEPYLGSLVEALLGRGVARLEGNEFQEALVDFARTQTLRPDSPQPALLLGKT